MADDQKFLTIAEAAAFLRVSETSLRRWTNSGKLRSFRVGGRNERRFLREDLLAFMPSVDDRATVPPPAASADTRERHVCLLFHDPEEQWHLLRPYLLAHLRA